jgi:hypothetical protein
VIGDVTGCSEGCVVYINFDVFVVRDGVVVHYIDSCVPLGNLGWDWRDRDNLDDRVKQRGSEWLSELGCPALEARG